MHDGTPTYSPYNGDSLEGLLPCSHFFEEYEYENEDKYNLEHDTSDKDSLMSDKDVDNEPEIFYGLLILLSMAYLKERAWTLWPWEILIWKKSMQFII